MTSVGESGSFYNTHDHQLVLTLSGAWLDSRSVWHSMKCTQNGGPLWDDVLTIVHRASPTLVPFKSWSSAMSGIISSSHASWQSSREGCPTDGVTGVNGGMKWLCPGRSSTQNLFSSYQTCTWFTRSITSLDLFTGELWPDHSFHQSPHHFDHVVSVHRGNVTNPVSALSVKQGRGVEIIATTITTWPSHKHRHRSHKAPHLTTKFWVCVDENKL